MTSTSNFNIGDKVKFIKEFDNHSPWESILSGLGCPPLTPGTTGRVTSIEKDCIAIQVTNLETGQDATVIVYDDTVSYARDSEKLDSLEIIEKAQIAA